MQQWAFGFGLSALGFGLWAFGPVVPYPTAVRKATVGDLTK